MEVSTGRINATLAAMKYIKYENLDTILTVSWSPGVLYHNQIMYPGMHNIDDNAVNQPNACAQAGYS